MIFDLHIHSNISPCSQMPLEVIISRARERGLDGICITDHHSMSGSSHIREGLQENGLCVIFGMEYTTPQGDFLIFGPFKGLPLGLNALELLTLVKRKKGVAIGAHPYRANRCLDIKLFQMGYLRLAEGINGRNSDCENHTAMKTLPEYDAILLGGSDAHREEEIGKIRTRIPHNIKSKEEFIKAVRAVEEGRLKAEIVLPSP